VISTQILFKVTYVETTITKQSTNEQELLSRAEWYQPLTSWSEPMTWIQTLDLVSLRESVSSLDLQV